MNPAESPAAARAVVQRRAITSGVRKTPPPVPVAPARSPIPPPTSADTGVLGAPATRSDVRSRRCSSGESDRGGDQHGGEQRSIDRIRDREAPRKKGGGDRPKQKWGEEAPGKEAGAREAHHGDGGNGEVEDERGGAHHLRGDPSQGHQGQIARRPRMADGGVEEGDQEEAEREEGEIGVRHARIIGVGAGWSEGGCTSTILARNADTPQGEAARAVFASDNQGEAQ